MPATLLIPGLNCSARVFAEQLPALWQHGPVTVADHRRGDSIPAIAEAILATAPPRFALVGFSMGGYVALEIVRQAPGRVARLALLATNARTDTEAQREKRRARIAKVEAGAFEEDIAEQFAPAVHPERSDDAGLFALHRTMAIEAGPDAFIAHSRALMQRRDQRDLLPAISCRTLVVAGDADQLMPPEVTEELAAGIAGARLVTLNRSGHLMPIEQPGQLTESLLGWLAD